MLTSIQHIKSREAILEKFEGWKSRSYRGVKWWSCQMAFVTNTFSSRLMKYSDSDLHKLSLCQLIHPWTETDCFWRNHYTGGHVNLQSSHSRQRKGHSQYDRAKNTGRMSFHDNRGILKSGNSSSSIFWSTAWPVFVSLLSISRQWDSGHLSTSLSFRKTKQLSRWSHGFWLQGISVWVFTLCFVIHFWTIQITQNPSVAKLSRNIQDIRMPFKKYNTFLITLLSVFLGQEMHKPIYWRRKFTLTSKFWETINPNKTGIWRTGAYKYVQKSI